MRTLDRECTGHTIHEDGCIWLVVRNTVGAPRPTFICMDSHHSLDPEHTLDLTWEEVAERMHD